MADQEQKLEFNFEMACDGCYNAAKRVLAKIGVDQEQVEADVPNHKLWVTSNKSAGQLVEALTKTGKKVLYVGPVSN